MNRNGNQKLSKNYKEFISDLVKMIHKKKKKTVTDDCLAPKCKSYMKKHGKGKIIKMDTAENISCSDSSKR